MPRTRLTSGQRERLHNELLAAFPSVPNMNALLAGIDRDFNQLSVPTYNLRDNVNEVIRTAEIEGWILDLVSQARTLIPNDPEFQALDEELQLRAQASPSELTTEGKAVTQQRIRPQVGSRPVRVFYSYSHQDEKFRERLEIHLAALRRQGLIDDWHDRKITAGNDWKNDIDNHLEAADVILLLVSSDFLASDYAYNREFKRTRATQNGRSTSCTNHSAILGLARDPNWAIAGIAARRSACCRSGDRAWTEVAKGLRRVVKEAHKAG